MWKESYPSGRRGDYSLDPTGFLPYIKASMSISRRRILRGLGASALVGSVSPKFHSFAFTASGEAQEAVGDARDPIHLDRNESAYGPSSKALEAMRGELGSAHRYPNSEYGPLIEKIAASHKVDPSHVVLGAGSREILRMAAEAYLSRRNQLVLGAPTFDPIAHFAESRGAGVIAVPLNRRYEHDLDGMLARIDASTGLVYICNPNNPTGTLTPRRDLEAFVRKLPAHTAVVIDEAYHHYVAASSDYASFIDSPVNDDRVVVLRTFSKIYGLAGMRVGYGVASPRVAQTLSASSVPLGVGLLAAKAAFAALDDHDFVRAAAGRNRDDRQEFFNQSNARMLRWIDSQTNFVMLNGGLPPQKIIDHYQKNGILLGPLIPEMPKFVRCSIGTTPEMLRFWRVWDSLPPHRMAM